MRIDYKKLIALVVIIAFVISIAAPLESAIGTSSSSSLFKVTIIAPGNANLLRRQWTQIFTSNLRELGIDANVVYLSWNSVYDRVLTPSADMVGNSYAQGGYDILALGWTPGLIPEPRQTYYGLDPGFFAPTGQNYYLWNNSESNALLDEFITASNDSARASALEAWQSLYYDQVPSSQIVYQQAPVVVNPAIGNLYTPVTGGGEGWLYFNAQPYPQLLTRSDGKTSIVYCSTGSIDALNPPESDSWYDVIVSAPIFDGLAEVWPTLNGLGDLETPALLTNWTSSNNGFTWTFDCRQGVTWQDGYNFTADDVVFSLWALMNSATGSQFTGYYQSVYGNNAQFTYSNGTSVTLGTGSRIGNITATDDHTVVANLPVCADDKPYGYFEPYLLSFANNIIPMHIFENIAPADWSTSVFNAPAYGVSQVVNGITYYGPVGTGPYMWKPDSMSADGQTIHLYKYDNYWNATGLESMGLFGIKDYYIRFISDGTSALAALKNGEVDMLDYNYQLQTDVSSVDASWGRVINLQGVGRQEFGYNMNSTIWGTGVDTPLGQSNPSEASQAATDVRIAFDYAIPRNLIINNLLAGYGTAGATPMLPTQPYYNTSITARPYDLSQAKYYLELAGYNVPAISSTTNVVNLNGHLTNITGGIEPDTNIALLCTTDNSTYLTSLVNIANSTTDANGFYSFTYTPSNPGTYYYYLEDLSNSSAPRYICLGAYTATATSSSIWSNPYTVPVIIVVVAIIVAASVLVVWLRKRASAESHEPAT